MYLVLRHLIKAVLLTIFLLSAALAANAQSGTESKQVYHVRSENRLSNDSKNLKSALRETPGISPGKLPQYDRVVDQYIQSMSEAKSQQDEKDAFILMQKRFDFPMNVNKEFMKKYLSEMFMSIGK